MLWRSVLREKIILWGDLLNSAASHRCIGQWHLSLQSDDCGPLPDAPFGNQAIRHIRIPSGECFGYGWRRAAEKQDRSVHGIGKGTAQHELPARNRLARVGDVRCTKGDSPFGGPVDDIIEEEIMYDYSLSVS
jgi:hypothetical protein